MGVLEKNFTDLMRTYPMTFEFDTVGLSELHSLPVFSKCSWGVIICKVPD